MSKLSIAYKYTPLVIALSSIYTVKYHIDSVSSFIKAAKEFLFKNEAAITDAAEIINQLTQNKALDKITAAWIRMEGNGGLQLALEARKNAAKQCASKANIDQAKFNQVFDCLKKSASGDAKAVEGIVKFAECSHMNPLEAMADINKAIMFGECINQAYQDA